jgi:hypothetical protein
METINENSLVISEFQDQQVAELDGNELDNITGGLFGAAAGAFVAGEIARRDGKSPKREYDDALIGAIGGAFAGLPGGPLGAALSTSKA